MDEASGHPSAKIAVWIVEDSEPFRIKLEAALRKLPEARQIRVFTEGNSMLAAMRRDSPPNVILLDVNLPGISGIDCIGHIKEQSSETEVMMLTVQDDGDSIARAISAGATGYLLKTATMEEVRRSVLEVVTGGAPLSPKVARSVVGLVSRPARSEDNHGLTQREKEVLKLLVDGATKKEVAGVLALSYHTVDKHVRGIYSKLGVRSLGAAVAKSVKDGIL